MLTTWLNGKLLKLYKTWSSIFIPHYTATIISYQKCMPLSRQYFLQYLKKKSNGEFSLRIHDIPECHTVKIEEKLKPYWNLTIVLRNQWSQKGSSPDWLSRVKSAIPWLPQPHTSQTKGNGKQKLSNRTLYLQNNARINKEHKNIFLRNTHIENWRI